MSYNILIKQAVKDDAYKYRNEVGHISDMLIGKRYFNIDYIVSIESGDWVRNSEELGNTKITIESINIIDAWNSDDTQVDEQIINKLNQGL